MARQRLRYQSLAQRLALPEASMAEPWEELPVEEAACQQVSRACLQLEWVARKEEVEGYSDHFGQGLAAER